MDEAKMVFNINDPLPSYIQQGIQRLLTDNQVRTVQQEEKNSLINEQKDDVNLLEGNKEINILRSHSSFLHDPMLYPLYKASLKTSTNNDEALTQTVKMIINFFDKSILNYSDASTRNQYSEQSSKDQNSEMSEFLCQYCKELLYQPVTLSCGHTFCRLCLESVDEQTCFICGKTFTESVDTFKNNVSLISILQKLHENEWKGRTLTAQGIRFLKNQKWDLAVEKFTATLEITPYSHVAYLNRAKAFIKLRKLNIALEDATKAVFLCRKWPEAYIVKGDILKAMNLTSYAVVSYLIGLFFEPCNQQVISHIREIVSSSIKRSIKKHAASSSKRSHQAVTSSSSTTDEPPMTSSKRESSPPSKRRRLSNSEEFVETSDVTTAVDDVSQVLLKKKSICRASYRCWSHSHRVKSDKKRKFGWITFASENETSKDLFSDSSEGSVSRHLSCDDEKSNSDLFKSLENDFIQAIFKLDRRFTGDLLMVCDSSLSNKLLNILELPTRPMDRIIETRNIDLADFECSLCMRVYYDPVCTVCGHVFCQRCLERSLDHTLHCPLCKQPLHHYLAESLRVLHHPCDLTMQKIIQNHLSEVYAHRKFQHLQEVEEITQSQPIFVCTIAFPSVPCPLHIFEPRYRLMLRRCLDHNKRSFGMCMPMPNTQHHNIGTLLKVRNVTFFQDGRSIVDCIGFRRFKALQSRMVDGYNTAKLQFIIDTQIEDDQTMERLIRIHEKVFGEAQEWFKGLTSAVTERIVNHFGSFPDKDCSINTENGPEWLWWVLAVIPVENRVKATILGKNSLRERLLIIHRIFVCLAQSSAQRSLT